MCLSSGRPFAAFPRREHCCHFFHLILLLNFSLPKYSRNCPRPPPLLCAFLCLLGTLPFHLNTSKQRDTLFCKHLRVKSFHRKVFQRLLYHLKAKTRKWPPAFSCRGVHRRRARLLDGVGSGLHGLQARRPWLVCH